MCDDVSNLSLISLQLNSVKSQNYIYMHVFSIISPKSVLLHYNSHKALQWDGGWLLNAGPVLGDLYKILTQVRGDVLGQRSVTKSCAVGGHAGSMVKIQDLLSAKYKTNINYTWRTRVHPHTVNVLHMAVY